MPDPPGKRKPPRARFVGNAKKKIDWMSPDRIKEIKSEYGSF